VPLISDEPEQALAFLIDLGLGESAERPDLQSVLPVNVPRRCDEPSTRTVGSTSPGNPCLAGRTDETTIGREWEQNPFIRVWRGVEPEGTERCRVGGGEATLIVWSPDYDGAGKAWVRFDDGRDAIVGGSRIQRL
jgi:hypothetical protein